MYNLNNTEGFTQEQCNELNKALSLIANLLAIEVEDAANRYAVDQAWSEKSHNGYVNLAARTLKIDFEDFVGSARIVEVDGGYKCFKTHADFEIWANQI